MITITTINNSYYFIGDFVVRPNSKGTYNESLLNYAQARDLLISREKARITLSQEDADKIEVIKGLLDPVITPEDLMAKQDKLVDTVNIKTVASKSILGAGDLELTVEDITGLEQGLVLSKDALTDLGSCVHVSGGNIVPTGGVTFRIESGTGYARDLTGAMIKVTWNTIDTSCPNTGNNYISIDYTGTVVINSTPSDGSLIYIGFIYTSASNSTILGLSRAKLTGKDSLFRTSEVFRTTVGSLVESGCSTAMQASPNEMKITITGGKIWTILNPFIVADTSTFTKLFSTNLGIVPDFVTPADTVNSQYWNMINSPEASALVPMTPGYFKKDLIMMTPEGQAFYVYGIAEYATLEEAEKAPLPNIPENIRVSIVRSAALVVEAGATSVAKVIDIRPFFARIFETGTAASNATVVSHSDLTDLGMDSHLQYHTDARADIRYYRKTESDNLYSPLIHSHSNATTSTSGYLSASDKTKLDGLNSTNLLNRTNHTGTQDVGTITGLTKSTVGLGNVPDVDATLRSNHSGTQAITTVTGLTVALDSKENTVAVGTTSQYYRGDKSWQTLDKSAVGLGNVVNADTTTTANITSSTGKRFVADADLIKLANTTNINSGDETAATIKTKLGVASTSVDGYLSSASFNTFNNKEATVTAGTTSQYYRGDKSWQTLNSAAVGLANVVNLNTSTTANITDSVDKRFVTDAQAVVLTNTSNTNTGDETTATIQTKLGVASTTTNGYLTPANFNIFNNKEPALTAGVSTQYYRGDKSWQPLAGGVTGQVQYNNGVGLSAASKVSVDAAGNFLKTVDNTPLTPTASTTITQHITQRANRAALALTDFKGITYNPQASLMDSSCWLIAAPASGTLMLPFNCAVTVAGQVANSMTFQLNGRDHINSKSRSNFTTSVLIGNLAYGFQSSNRVLFTNQTTPSSTLSLGFTTVFRFNREESTPLAGARIFVGMTGATTTPTNVSPTTLLNSIGMYKDTADTNWKLYSAGSSAGVSIDLGVNFPTTTNVALYDLMLHSPKNSGVVYYEVTRVDTGVTVAGQFAGANLPSGLQFMSPRWWITNNTTAAATTLTIHYNYGESFR